jgi:AcrR family transcriptional regulator
VTLSHTGRMGVNARGPGRAAHGVRQTSAVHSRDVPPRRRSRTESSEARDALLDAAERLMMEEGYAAVSSRRVATQAGVTVGLVYYYFATMDDLFIALFRRGAERSLERQAQVLSSAQPLWGLWDLTHQQSNPAVTMEFIALANHRKAIRAEIAEYSRKFRTMQLEVMGSVLEGYGLDPATWPPASVMVMMTGISRFLLIEEAFDLDTGHAETVALIEQQITALEGPRQQVHDDPAPERAPMSF